VQRISTLARLQDGEGFVQQFETDGQQQTVGVVGVKSPVQLEDELLQLFVWVWSLKDHLKDAYSSKGLDPQLIELLVNESPALQYVSDIANRAKHGTLTKSRSSTFAELVEVGITIPHSAMAKVVYVPNAVGVHVDKPKEVELCAKVQPRGTEAIDAFAVLEESIAIWEHHAFSRIAA
jgi:hypothetical protein